MSRIDEAMRKAGLARDERRGTALVEPRSVVADASVLERYTSEQLATPTPLETRKPRPAPVAVPSPAASQPMRAIPVAPAYQGKLVISPEIAPYTVEQYRRLATVLNDLQIQRGVKTLMVSSAAPREGKTHTITNLALTFSESFRQRVLLIDADLRKPSIHEVFGIRNGVGLADVVRAPSLSLPLVELSPYLSLITAGRTGPTPLAHLSSETLRTSVASASTRFDWVLLDTPPIGLLPDAQLVARICDGVLFVIGAGISPYSLVQRGIASLGPDHIIGTILNRADGRLAQHGYGHGYDRDYPAYQ
jgi:protein-tyrosine kinase